MGAHEHLGSGPSGDDITIAEVPPDTTPRAAARPVLAPGTRLGRYMLLEEVGAGGMGVVMAAYDRELDRRVALKLLRPHMSRAGEARMQREAQALAQLQHPAVVTVYEVGTVGGQRFIAMEYVEGQTFDRWAASRREQWRAIVEVAVRAGRGLAAAHAAGLVHRDVKPSNILVGRDGRVCVADFGIATAAGRPSESRHGSGSQPGADSEETVELSGSLAVASASIRVDGVQFTEAGAVVGTPAYMAPEQHRGDVVDARSDQFAFCVTLYRVLYDDTPFAGHDLESLRRSIVMARVKPAPAGSRVPASVRRILLRGLAVEPTRRWPSMTALLDALEQTLRARRRRTLQLAVAGGVGVLGVLTVALALEASDAEPVGAGGCPGADERLAGVWDDERAAALREVFTASALPYALDTWTRTRDRLDGQAQAWSTRYQDVCTAMAEQPAAALDLEMACLGRRRDELGALVDLLLEGEPATVIKATQAAAELEPVASCRTAGLEAAAMPEPEPSQREEVDEIRLTLARAEAAYRTGMLAKGIAHAEQARERARVLGYGPVEVEALYRLGSLQALSGRLDEAQQSLGQAALRAVEVRHDRVAVQAATMQAFVVGYHQERHEDGMVWVRHATAALERLGADPLLEAELRITRASILNSRGQYEQALGEFRAALEQREQHLGTDHPMVGASYNNLGGALTLLGRHDEALEAMERARAIWRDSFGPRHPVVATAINGIGAVLERVGRWQEARARFEEALALREAAFGPEHVNVALSLDNLGSVLTRLGEYDQARSASQRALQMRERSLGPRHPHCASSLVNLGLVAEHQERLSEATGYQRRAIEIWEETLGPEHPYLGFPLTSLGRIAYRQGEAERARALLERALRLREAGDPFERAETELALARVLWPDEPARARLLAEHAAVGLEGTAHVGGQLHREVEAWLAAHPVAAAGDASPG